MNYFYYQKEGGNEEWKPIPETQLADVADCMLVTVLSVSEPIGDDFTKEQFADVKYKGPMYFDLDDASSPASTSIYAVELVKALEEKGVNPESLNLYASGGKGFHVLVPEAVFMEKAPKVGLQYLPHIYKECAYRLAVESMDMRVYTARKGRMFRQCNVLRDNGRYKVPISWTELQTIAELAKNNIPAAEEMYVQVTSKQRPLMTPEPVDKPVAMMMALFDEAKSKVAKSAAKAKKRKPTKLPENLPSFEALLRGEGIKSGVGFHQLALQIAITAHARGMTEDDLLSKAEGLIQTHDSDGYRYNTAAKRRNELKRMYDYTDDNPCYEYAGAAVASLLTHAAPDLKGLDVTDEEVAEGMAEAENAEEGESEFDHAGVTMTQNAIFIDTDNGMKKILGVGFADVTELVSLDSNNITVIEADIMTGGRKLGRRTFELDQFNSTSSVNKVMMGLGQAFMGSDAQARGTFMRMVEKARKNGRRMYVTAREGLDTVSLPFHDNEELRKPFLVWADNESVKLAKVAEESNVQLKFVGYPSVLGHYKTDLSSAPSLKTWLEEPGNKDALFNVMKALVSCQRPAYLGKLIGWMVACNYRMLFHKKFGKFPLLHINGAAGAGKTEMTKLMAYFHYFSEEPKMLTPTSTIFAVANAASGSASVPLVLDEFKPGEMSKSDYDRLKLLLRDAYNCRNVERGGGNRENADYRAVHTTALSAPICFIAEAVVDESALMERVVLLTLSKPPVIQAQEYLRNFMYADSNRHVLSILGKFMVSYIVSKYTPDMLQEEFLPIYNDARKTLMLQAGEDEILSEEDVQRKSNAKERTVYNFAVAQFGLQKLKNLLENFLGDRKDWHEIGDLLQEMCDEAYSTVAELQAQTIPEWLKVLNAFADMSHLDPLNPSALKPGIDYAYLDYNGKECIELYARACYMKYRSWCSGSRTYPLYPTESAFTHALNSLPALEAKGLTQKLRSPGGSHIFSLGELRSHGFISPRQGGA